MNITKLGHCCLVIEVDGLRIMTDPGEYSTAQDEVTNIGLILITHEHPDHLHIDSLKKVLFHNPDAHIITNDGVGEILTKEGILFSKVRHKENISFKNVLIEGFGEKHAEVYPTITPVDNTGYFIGNRFFYPGDALYNPQKKVEILALPVAGPWLKISDAVDYAKAVNPVHCFPVHDGMLKFIGAVHSLPQNVLTAEGIDFKVLEEKKEYEF